MEIQIIHDKLDQKCPNGYRINEIISFGYPYRRIIMDVIVNKSPEKSIQQVYSVFLRTILAGFKTEQGFIKFLGLHKEDFILRELYFLKERGFVDVASGIWLVTGQGKAFIKDNSILKVLEEEQFEFLIDAKTDEVLPKPFKLFSDKNNKKKLLSGINYPIKSPEILENKNEQLADVYKQEYKGEAYLVDYDKSKIKFDKAEYHDYYLIEYIPELGKEQELEAYIEIRNTDRSFSLNRRLSKILLQQYPTVLYEFSDSERTTIAEIYKEDEALVEAFKTKPIVVEKGNNSTETLSIWETQAKFKDALKKVKKRILIESPWIKRATLEYIPLMRKALEKKVEIVILYGIESNDNHHQGTMMKLQKLSLDFPFFFNLIHLPSHFEDIGNTKMTGTHRKLVIKDEEYYIQGSFNFLSFNRKEGQTVANEESILIKQKVTAKWNQVFREYSLSK